MAILKNYWKQFAVWATGLRSKVFEKEHIKLTVYYTLLVACVLGLYSLVLYFSFSKDLKNNFYIETSNVGSLPFERTLENLQKSIVAVDLTALAIAGVISYVLAGSTLKPMKESLEAQKQFSANASHELRTPLTIIKTDTEVLLRNRNGSSEDFKLLALRNLEEAEHMSKIVENLLALSRNEKTGTNLFAEMDLSRKVVRLLKRIRHQALKKDIKVIVRKMDRGVVQADSMAIDRAILNILQNAINFTLPGGKIEIALENRKKHMKLTVADSGIGISKKSLPHIFKRFYKGNTGNSTQGAGLGLAIVKEIIDNHQGEITIKSRLHKGTSVIIKLPKTAQILS